MSRDLRPVLQPIALSIPDAAAATGYSETVLKAAIARGDLAPHYENTKGVLLAEDLVEWVKSLPTEPQRRPKPQRA
ncbi:hypothetical protein ACF1AJ_20670 [Leifsonia sp. NPDC014704]|uniref:hypothetical protein n=1 Tax=Leifsonia sp. NPDC014704 TaxID=3364123 RepID=UPI0036F47646